MCGIGGLAGKENPELCGIGGSQVRKKLSSRRACLAQVADFLSTSGHDAAAVGVARSSGTFVAQRVAERHVVGKAEGRVRTKRMAEGRVGDKHTAACLSPTPPLEVIPTSEMRGVGVSPRTLPRTLL